MLDLQKLSKTKKLYEIKMWDGQELTLKLPSQKLLQELMGLQGDLDDPLSILDQLYELLTSIFNLNTQGIKYEADVVKEELDLATAAYVIQDYIASTTKTLGES